MRENGAINAIFDSALQVNKEKRKFTRIALSAKVSMILDDRVIEGELVNLSLNGAFVRPAQPVELNSTVRITILETTASRSLTDLKAKVVRVTDEGIGLQFG
jgi:hypothetical protein